MIPFDRGTGRPITAAGLTFLFATSALLHPSAAEKVAGKDRDNSPSATQSVDSDLRIRLLHAPTQRVEVTGLSPASVKLIAQRGLEFEATSEIFTVAVKPDDKAAPLAAMLGRYRIEGGRLVFEPRFALRPGVAYRAVVNLSRIPGSKAVGLKQPEATQDFTIPKRPTEPTIITNVFPSRDVLPENQLKFYIHFSAPMSRGEAYRRVRLLDASGTPVEGAFLELREELWDQSATRFTLFFDPGRIKRGLKPREEFGPVLEEGKSYTFVVDSDWLDAHGNPLKTSFRKSFRVTAPDDTQPKIANWKLTLPASGTRQPLTVDFEDPLDQGMLERVLHVIDRQGQAVRADRIETRREETRWIFHPADPWKRGAYSLTADSALEDLAGNSLKRQFEVDVFREIEREIVPETVSVPFEVER